MHSRLFGCLTKLGAQRAELVQKFMPRSRVGIFRNEHTRSTPLDPKLTFWCFSYYLGAFETVWLLRNERTVSTPLDPKLTFWCVSNYLGASRTVWLPYETRCKTGRKVQKFVPRSRVRIFRNERTRFSHLDPKLMFWCVSYDLGAIGTVWLPYENRCKTG